MDKKTLTLTEVLITIVVIGIISAITIPAVVNMTYKKELETAFKKQFSSLKQAVLLIKSKDSVLLDFENYKMNLNQDWHKNIMLFMTAVLLIIIRGV